MTTLSITAVILFALAVIHTFSVSFFQQWAHKYPKGSIRENMLHLLGEVEVVFGFWAGIYVLSYAFMFGPKNAVTYLNQQNFTEPAFVFVIMTVCSTRPIMNFATTMLSTLTRALPINQGIAFYLVVLTIGPILGSFITEPAAMTVTALILRDRFFSLKISDSLKFATLGLLFVNISVGGVFTPYSAPPVIMVASKWNWDLVHMLTNFGWKGGLVTVISTILIALRFRKELCALPINFKTKAEDYIPSYITFFYLLFLTLIVFSSHYLVVFAGIFLFFIGLVRVTSQYQKDLDIKNGLLVAFFLGGLIILGEQQKSWIEPLITSLNNTSLFLGSIGLTAILDNAALTFLGSQVENLSSDAKYYLVSGAITGGGLTIIANAPNPAGFTILNSSFGESGITPIKLFLNAIIPTLIAALGFYFL